MFHPIRVVLVLLPLALFTTACGNDTVGGGTLPTTPTPPTLTTETFEGTVTVNGAITHSFIVTAPSTLTATLVSLADGTEGVTIGMSLGTWNGEYCQIVLTNDTAIQGKFIVGVAQTAGNFCLRVADATGQLTQPASYQVTVTHQ
jgi:hypothetical protein